MFEVLVMLVAACFGFTGNWRLPTPMDFGVLVLTGLLSGAAIVAPFRYSALIWGLLIGFLVWDRWL